MKRSSVGLIVRAANITLGIVNVALFGLWWSIIKIDSGSSIERASERFFSAISLQITILSVVVGLGAVVLGALGFMGFRSIENSAERMAESTAKQVMQDYIQSLDNGRFSRSETRKSGGEKERSSLPDPAATEEEEEN